MMRYLLLIAVPACIGCADRLPLPADAGSRISARLATHQACVPLPDDGEWTDVRGDQVSIRGFPGPGGGFVYPDRMDRRTESIRAAFDLLTELGLYTVEEEDLPGPLPGRMRNYTATPFGEPYIRFIEGGHAESGWFGLCYGERRLLAIHRVGRIEKAPCRVSRDILYSYHYVGIPAWADDPRLRRFFPDMIGSAEARTERGASDTFVHNGDNWHLEQKVYGPWYVPCIDLDDGSARPG